MDHGRPVSEAGAWELDVLQDGARVSFHDFTASWSEVPLRGIWPARVEQRIGTTRLLANEELKLY